MLKIKPMSDAEIAKTLNRKVEEIYTIPASRIARAAQLDLLKQLFRYTKKTEAIVPYGDNWDIDITPAHDFFVDIQSVISEMEKE